MNYPSWAGHIIYLEKRPQLAVMASIALIALTLFINQAITLVRLVRSTPVAATATTTMPTHPKPIPKVIASVALFGDPTIAADEAANKNLPTTNLQLVLRGAVVESNEAKSSAVIEDPSKAALSYKVGDTLPGNAVLNAVFADHVVLKRNGQLETLNFPIQSKLSIKDNENVGIDNNVGKGNTSKSRIPNPTVQSTAPNSGNTPPQSIQERLQQLQQQHEQH